MKLWSLEERILSVLHNRGPITAGQLAMSLKESFGMVLFGLEKLRDKEDKVRVLAGGLWDVTVEYRRQKSDSAENEWTRLP